MLAQRSARADVRGHDHHRVAEVDRAALAVGQPAVVEDLQQHVEHLGVRLLDLVEEDDRVRPPPHRLGQLAALLVADVARAARRRAARPCAAPGTRDMSSRTIARSSSNMNSASARASSVFPTPVGPRKMNEPIGRFGSCRPVRARRSAFATASTASSWPTTRCVQPLLHVDQLLGLALEQPRRPGSPVQRRDDRGDVVLVDLLLHHRLGLGRRSRSASSFSSAGSSP